MIGFLVKYKFGLVVATGVMLAGGLGWKIRSDIQEEERERVLSAMAANTLRTEREARARSDSVTSAAREEIRALRVQRNGLLADETVRLQNATRMVRHAEIVIATAGANVDATMDTLRARATPAIRPVVNLLVVQIADERRANQNLRGIDLARITSQATTITTQAEIIASQDELEAIRVTERAAMQAELDAFVVAYEASLAQVEDSFWDGLATVGKYVLATGTGVVAGKHLF